MSYSSLMHELKSKLNNHIKFHSIVYLIHTDEYEEIDTIVNNNEIIMRLVQTIINEIHAVGRRLEQKLNDLIWLNDMLLKFGKEAQASITQAKKVLKSIHINIFDLEKERIEKRTTKTLLKKELRKHPERRFPLKFAKEYETLKVFLITM
jgi:hypothetical protein